MAGGVCCLLTQTILANVSFALEEDMFSAVVG